MSDRHADRELDNEDIAAVRVAVEKAIASKRSKVEVDVYELTVVLEDLDFWRSQSRLMKLLARRAAGMSND